MKRQREMSQTRNEKKETKVRTIVSGTETEVAADRKKTKKESFPHNDVSWSLIPDRWVLA